MELWGETFSEGSGSSYGGRLRDDEWHTRDKRLFASLGITIQIL